MPFRSTSEPFGLLAAQQAVWMADRASPDPSAFLSADVATLPPSLEPELFVQACHLAIQTIEALRLRFSGLSAQMVTPFEASGLQMVDFSADPDPQTACSNWLDASLRNPIDPAKDAPFTWTLLRVAPNRWLWSQVVHHAVADATGRHLVARQVAEIYDALASGARPPQPSGAPGLADLVAAEASYLTSDQYRTDGAWCLAQCHDPPAAQSLSGRSTGISLIGRRASLNLAPTEAAALRQVAAQLGGSLAQLLCAAWAALIGRLCGQSDLLIGFQVAARRPVARETPAMTTNQMPLRLSMAAGTRFVDLVSQTTRQCRAALRHQHYPALHLRRALHLTPSDPDPLDVGFNFLPLRDPLTIGGEPLLTRNLSHGPVRDLMLAVEQDTQAGLRLDLDANRDRYGTADAQRLIERLALMLRHLMVTAENTGSIQVADLPIMTPAERELVEVGFSMGDPTPPPTPLSELLADTACRVPDAIALHVGDARLSYRGLIGRARQFGRYLLDHGLVEGDVVAIALPRSDDAVVAIIACMLAGLPVCLLDPAHPPARQAHMLAVSRARIVLAHADAGETLGDVRVLAVDTPAARAAVAAQSSHAIAASVDPRTTAYVAFTSGSTGRPKGVAVTQAAVVQQVLALRAHLPLGVGDTVLCATTFTFDVAMADLFLALTSGAAIRLLREQEMRDPAAIRDAALDHPSPLLQATPSVWRSLPIESLPTSMRAVIGGEAFPMDLLPRLLRLSGVFNVYGPTETTVWASLQRIDATLDATLPVAVGRPIAGYRMAILDPANQPVPVGGIGELCIGGPAVADGYLDQPELTHTVFVAAPLGGGRMYRTGDLARWRTDGAIELIGRRDGQIKIAGHRIELTEIEQVLLDLPWVSEVAILAHGDSAKRRLAAYVLPATGATIPDLAGLRLDLAKRLPPWMLPAELVVLAAMPHTTSGKIDRRALQPPGRATDERLVCPPVSPLEAKLRDAFARVTNSSAVSADDDFFDVGGDSLAATILLTELSQAGLDLKLPVLLDRRTPAAIATWLDAPATRTPAAAHAATVFLIPGIGGDNPDLAQFRTDCTAEIRFVLLEYPDWAILLPPDFDMAALIGDFVARVRAFAPPGAIVLAGYSLGGVVAVATASALREAGQDVAGLLLFDLRMIRPAIPFTHTGSQAQRAMRALGAVLRDFREGDIARTLGPSIARRLARRPGVLRRLIGLRATRLPTRWRYWVRFQLCVELQAKVVEPWRKSGLSNAMRLAGMPTILFRASGVLSVAASDPGWHKQGVELRVIDVPGDHYSMLRQRGDGSLCQLVGPVVAELLADRASSGPD